MLSAPAHPDSVQVNTMLEKHSRIYRTNVYGVDAL